MPTATCERGSYVSIWKVHHSNQTFTCRDVDWTCTCLFYKSNHLLCRQMMHMARKGHSFEMLPGTFDVLGVKDYLSSATDALQPIVRMSKLRLPKVSLSDDNSDASAEAPTIPLSKKPKQVAYVRLCRREQANQVVLSSAEKYSYAKAMLEPLLEHLSNLSSADFHQELSAWKDTVEVGLRREKTNLVNADDESEDDILDADTDSTLDPADAMDTTNLMDVLETASPECSSDSSSGDDEVPATQIREMKQEHPPSTVTSVRQVDVISVPMPKSRGRSRSTTKQLRQTKLTLGPQRLAVHKYPSGLTVSLHELVIWARSTPNAKYVMEIMEKYPVQLEDAYLRSRTIDCQWEAIRSSEYMHNFVIPADLTRSMQAAITTTKSEQAKTNDMDDRVKKQGIVLDIIASIDPKLWKFSSQFVHASATFYDIKAKGRAWFKDRKWLEQVWRKVTSDVDLFARQTKTSGLSANAVCDRHQVMANEVISKFASARLRTEFGTLSGQGLSFENIVGGLCRGIGGGRFWIIITYMAVGWPTMPNTPIGEIKFIVNPVNLKANHWGTIILRLKTTEKTTRLHVYMYEPLIDEGYREEMETVWVGIPKNDNDEQSEEREGLRGFVLRWHEASMPKRKLIIDPIDWVETPQQPDGASCGILVVAQAYNYLTGNVEQQTYNVSSDDIKVMRLRMLWVIMNISQEKVMAGSDAAKANEIQQKLQDELK
ncbi:Ulp1 protease family, C-terminal catalytic domain [Phytophthora cactorum]|nr:Ulp1 protease family, C-terminal catalytic domain [Phytophthora cactorum]